MVPLYLVPPLFFAGYVWPAGDTGHFDRGLLARIAVHWRPVVFEHAHTELGCILVSALFEAAAMLLLPKLFFELYLTLLFGGALCVCMLAPVNNGKIHLSSKELSAMRWRGWLRVLILIVASLALFYNGAFELAVSLALAIFFTAISLMLAVVGLGEQ